MLTVFATLNEIEVMRLLLTLDTQWLLSLNSKAVHCDVVVGCCSNDVNSSLPSMFNRRSSTDSIVVESSSSALIARDTSLPIRLLMLSSAEVSSSLAVWNLLFKILSASLARAISSTITVDKVDSVVVALSFSASTINWRAASASLARDTSSTITVDKVDSATIALSFSASIINWRAASAFSIFCWRVLSAACLFATSITSKEGVKVLTNFLPT